ncbi:hypothetical protein Syun_017133 [Stephania yunnanensis]|uniref:Uncharacterized protein n=1 Tax=Stephania yunnanensis TaxID=152371 RepID=A0AAP0P5J5_9MAGN
MAKMNAVMEKGQTSFNKRRPEPGESSEKAMKGTRAVKPKVGHLPQTRKSAQLRNNARSTIPSNTPSIPIVIPDHDEDDDHVGDLNLRGLRARQLFERLGWMGFVVARDPISNRFVRLFDPNLHCKDSKKLSKLHSSIDGVVFKVNTRVIRKAFNLPKGSFRCFKSNWWPEVGVFDPLNARNLLTGRTDITTPRKPLLNEVTIEARLAHKQVAHVLAPKVGSITWMTFYDVFLMWCVLTGAKIDLPHIIGLHMLRASVKPRSSIPYSNHLSRIFTTVGLSLPFQNENGRVINLIGEASLAKMNYKLVNGKWIVLQGKGSARKNKKKSTSPPLLFNDTTDDETYQSDIGSEVSDDSKDTNDEAQDYEYENKDSADDDSSEDDLAMTQTPDVALGVDDAVMGGEASQLEGNVEGTQKKLNDGKANEPVDEAPIGMEERNPTGRVSEGSGRYETVSYWTWRMTRGKHDTRLHLNREASDKH